MTRPPDIDAIEQRNIELMLQDGPRIRTGYGTWIEARDPGGYILRGGLGAMGVGRMWCAERPGDANEPGYDTAPLTTRPCEVYAPGDVFRSCDLPYGHNGPHHAPIVFHDEITWEDPR